jgi:hypothetical protein
MGNKIILIVDDEDMVKHNILFLVNDLLLKYKINHTIITIPHNSNNLKKAQEVSLDELKSTLFELHMRPSFLEELFVVKDIALISDEKNNNKISKFIPRGKKDQYFKEKNLKVVKKTRTTKK